MNPLPFIAGLRRWAWLLVPLAAAVLAGAAAGFILVLTRGLPQVEELQTFEPSAATVLLADDGTPFKSYFLERRIPIPLEKVPPDLVRAIIAVEDARFYRHFGIDLRGIARALWRDLTHGRIVEGGSTLTQQLAKVLFLTPEKTAIRKLREAVLALNIERRYTKQEILTLYLNQVYLGEGAYGVEAAARAYFGKSVSDLTLPECALIAGLPRNPSGYSPLTHPERAEERRRVVLRRLREEGDLDEERYRAALAERPVLRPAPAEKETGSHFAEMVRRTLEETLGYNLLYRGGLTVRTTLNLEMQRAAEKAVAGGIAAYEKRHPPKAGQEPVQAALLALNPTTGEVKALVGGRDFAASPFNRAVQARRQTGSAFKPILYAAALAAGSTPSLILSDEPMVLRLPGVPEPWSPENYAGIYNGPVTMRTALENSLNAASVRLLLRTGYEPVMETARRLGITADLRPYPSLALGAFDASLEEMVAAYAAFANGGILVRPRFLLSAADRGGRALMEGPPPGFSEALPPQTAFQLTNLLIGVVERGTAKAASSLGLPLAGKTGTTNDFKDAWFIGFSPALATGVWVGYDLPRSLGPGEAGSRAALPIWMDFMKAALQGIPPVRFPIPPEVEMVEVDRDTGLLAAPGCSDPVMEAFVTGTVPTAPCPGNHRRSLTATPLD